MKPQFRSWGRVVASTQDSIPIRDDAALEKLLASATTSVLPYGNGRSYGDSNLNPGGKLLEMRPLARILAFDAASGVLTCEAGTLLSEIIAHAVPRGWFLTVAPGTQFVTVGGAIANDVHGKNHHRFGSFGNHVLDFELLRSDGSRRTCSATQNADWFAATIGGLGLTGVIARATLQLRRIANPYVDGETIRFRSLEEFFELSRDSEAGFEYTVAWIDCAFGGKQLGRGLFNRGNHAAAGVDLDRLPAAQRSADETRTRRMPFSPPISLINPLTLKAFNFAYFHRQRGDHARLLQHYRPFFFPLDAVLEWNRMYGPHGFYQYQSVVPDAHALRCTRQMLQTISDSGMGSFLAVLKQFGTPVSRGMLSFPTAGTTLALDFPNRGARLHRLFEALDRIVLDAGGRLYPAKDGRMGPQIFKAGYPRWQEFSPFIDPKFSSGFWRRVMPA